MSGLQVAYIAAQWLLVSVVLFGFTMCIVGIILSARRAYDFAKQSIDDQSAHQLAEYRRIHEIERDVFDAA